MITVIHASKKALMDHHIKPIWLGYIEWPDAGIYAVVEKGGWGESWEFCNATVGYKPIILMTAVKVVYHGDQPK